MEQCECNYCKYLFTHSGPLITHQQAVSSLGSILAIDHQAKHVLSGYVQCSFEDRPCQVAGIGRYPTDSKKMISSCLDN